MNSRIELQAALMGAPLASRVSTPGRPTNTDPIPVRPIVAATAPRSVLQPSVSRRYKSSPRSAAPHLPRVIWIATDFSKTVSVLVERAARLPHAPGAVFTWVHVTDGARSSDAARRLKLLSQNLKQKLGNVGNAKVAVKLLRGTPWKALSAEASKASVDLLVVGEHGERKFRDLLLGSTAERVLRATQVPVLLVRLRKVRPYQRVLVGLDLTECSRRAFQWAVDISGGGDSLQAVHAYDVEPWRRKLSSATRSQLRALAAGQASSRWDRFSAAAARTPVTLVLRDGDPRDVLLDEARRQDADLLVLGTHGRTGMDHWILGSVAEVALRSAPCDVLIARNV
jgi:nucleotide-binding universal stress UspA family protein